MEIINTTVLSDLVGKTLIRAAITSDDDYKDKLELIFSDGRVYELTQAETMDCNLLAVGDTSLLRDSPVIEAVEVIGEVVLGDGARELRTVYRIATAVAMVEFSFDDITNNRKAQAVQRGFNVNATIKAIEVTVINELVGAVLVSAVLSEDDNEIIFTFEDGRVYHFRHDQDCCEHVYVESIIGDLQDLVGTPLTMAEEVSNASSKNDMGSETWTFYKFATIKGYVDVRWLGSSNGYYGEGVNHGFKEGYDQPVLKLKSTVVETKENQMDDKVEKITNSSISGAHVVSSELVNIRNNVPDIDVAASYGKPSVGAEIDVLPLLRTLKANTDASIDLLVKDDTERSKNMELARTIHVPTIQDGVSYVDLAGVLHQPIVQDGDAADVANPGILELGDVIKIDTIGPITDRHYQNLRNLFNIAITDALTSGKAVYDRSFGYNDPFTGKYVDRRILSFDTWLSTLHEDVRQHYTCRACRDAWSYIFNVCVQETDGTLKYPAVDVLLLAHAKGDPVIENLFRNAPGGTDGFKAYLKEAIEPRDNELFPMFKVPLEKNSDTDSCGWTHFHLADMEVLETYNENRTTFGDVLYADGLFKRLIDERFDGGAFTQLCETIRKEILDKKKETFTVIDGSALMRYPDLVTLVAEIQLYHKVSRTGLTYLHERLGRSANGWLRHLNGSVLGNALDAYFELLDNPNDFKKIFDKVVRILDRAVDSANYKNKVAEAKPATIEQAYNFLTENGLDSTLMRRLIDMDEVKHKVWTASPIVAVEEAKADNSVNTLDAAYNTVMATKDTEANRLEQVKKHLGLRFAQVEGKATMSIKEFISRVGNYASMSLCLESNAKVQPYLATTSITPDVDHGKLLRFVEQFVEHMLYYTTPAPVPSQIFAFENLNDKLEIISRDMGGLTRLEDLEVNAVLETVDRDDNRAYIANIPGAGGTISHMFKGYGTAIIPSVLQGEHYGMGKAFQELSAKLKLCVKEGCSVRNAVGGVYIIPGMTFDVVLKDGSKESVYLTSYA